MNEFIRRIRRWSKRSKLLAICDDNIEKWLESLGILERVKCGEINCFICKGDIDINNIQFISQFEGEIILICDKPDCIYSFTEEYKKE